MSELAKFDPLLKAEVATVQKDITYPAFLGMNLLRHHDDTLTTRGGSRSYRIYDDIERDCHAYGVLTKRKLAVIARPWQVDPASQSPADVAAAELVRSQLENIGVPELDNPEVQIACPSNFDTVCYNLLDALLKGFAVGEVMWDYEDGQYIAREVRPRDQRRFSFDLAYQLRLKNFHDMILGETVPPKKFLVHSWGAKDSSPYGLGLGSRLFWPSFFKRTGITYWLTFLDKFGSPTALGKYPNGTQPSDQVKLLDALNAIAQDAGIAVPEGMEVELLEATRGGTAGYEGFCRYMDEQMSYAVLGEAAGAQNSGGALASVAILRNEVRLELVQADADLLSATLNSTLIPWITYFNCPGAKPPKVQRIVKASEDLKVRSERDKNLFAMGFRPTLAHVQETYGGEWEQVQPARPKPALGGDPNDPTDFAEAFGDPGQDALDAAIAALSPSELQAQTADTLKPVIEFIRQGGDPIEAMQKLATLYPAMDTARLEEMLARAIFVAEVWGRLSAADA